LESVTATAGVDHWLEAFRRQDVPAAPCLGIDEHLADDQVAHNRIYTITEQDGLGAVRAPRYPARFSSAAGDLTGPGGAPRLGAHTEEVLAELAGEAR
jgi:crotonobetainyl-CoA:carnitine CoA-transferase CaiB-like acyl-CoA transferase